MLACNKWIFVGFETINFEFPVHVLTTKLTQHENTFIIPFIVQTLPHKLSLTLSPLSDSWWVSWSSRSPHFCPPRSDHLPSSVLQQRRESAVKTWVRVRASARWSVTWRPSSLSKAALTKRTTKYHGITQISDAYPGGVIVFFEVSYK